MPSPFESSITHTTDTTGDVSINALLGGTRWNNSIIQYSFPHNGNALFWSSFFNDYGSTTSNGEPWDSGFKPLTNSDQVNFQKALQQWANVADIEFVQVSETANEVGDIRAAYTSDPNRLTLAWTYLPSDSPVAGDIWINTRGLLSTENWEPGTLSFETILHEIGHTLGLKHPFNDTGDANETTLPAELDKTIYTIMSYTYANLEGMEGTGFSFHPTTPMVLDIAAIQYLYGKNADFHSGNDTYHYTDADTYHETIWDAGGTDTINYSGWIPSLFDLNPAGGSIIGQSVYVQKSGIDLGLPVPNIWIADNVTIENVSAGQGNDIVIGNNSSNDLNGGLGIDTVIVEAPQNKFVLAQTLDSFTLTEKDAGNHQDRLFNMERLTFDDIKLALDLDGHAGKVVKLLGAVFGVSAIDNPAYVGIGLIEIDQGLSYQQLGEFAIQAIGATDHEQIASLLWENVFGVPPKNSEILPYVDMLDRNEISPGDLAVLAADSSYNLENINFFELNQTGIAFT
ncbi:MAG: M10 family metallopeptidase [Nitrosomonas sp.]|nr:MAG: M10 family metallopeptidase [Nitrosomonas sp.]